MKRDPLITRDPSFVERAPSRALGRAKGTATECDRVALIARRSGFRPVTRRPSSPRCSRRRPAVQFRRERWDTPDGDFIDLDWLAHHENAPAQPDAPLFVLFHGLEGSSDSHYARVLMAAAKARGWHGVVPHFRSCSGPLNLLPRFYHLADSNEVDWVLRRLGATHSGPIIAAGVSLGGNVLLRWLCERESDASVIAPPPRSPRRSTCTPAARRFRRASAWSIRAVSSSRSSARRLAKLAQYPGLFDRDAMLAARTLYEFDNVVTAPLHGFRDTDDYWTSATTRPFLPRIAVPTLVLNARNDPFLPGCVLPSKAEVSAAVTLDQPDARRPRRLHDGAVSGADRLAFATRVRLPGNAISIMDDIVKQALAKWPNVPHCTGWLMLDRRGNGACATTPPRPRANSATSIRHEALIGFINRNYESDDARPVVLPERAAAGVCGTGLYAVDRAAAADRADGALGMTDQAGAAFEPAHALARRRRRHAVSPTRRRLPASPRCTITISTCSRTTRLSARMRAPCFTGALETDLAVEPIKRAEVAGRFGFVTSPAAAGPLSRSSSSFSKLALFLVAHFEIAQTR